MWNYEKNFGERRNRRYGKRGSYRINSTFWLFWGCESINRLVIDKWHELYGQNIKGKVMVYPEGRGSTVGAAVVLELVRTGCAPAAIINRKIETITAAGGLMAKKFYNKDMPMVDRLSEDPIKAIKTGDIVEVNGTTGEVTIYSR